MTSFSEPGGIRTPNLLGRNQGLYPVKLPVRLVAKCNYIINSISSKKKEATFDFLSEPGGIRTPNLLGRNQGLYPVKLPVRCSTTTSLFRDCGCKSSYLSQKYKSATMFFRKKEGLFLQLFHYQ